MTDPINRRTFLSRSAAVITAAPAAALLAKAKTESPPLPDMLYLGPLYLTAGTYYDVPMEAGWDKDYPCYSSKPTIMLEGGGGSGAVATASLRGGRITSITVNS